MIDMTTNDVGARSSASDATMDTIATPFLKWTGGKGAIADQIIALLPRDARERVWREPFLGGGAVFFRLRPRRAILSDALDGLIGAYLAVRDVPTSVLRELETLRVVHLRDPKLAYYRARDDYNALPQHAHSARRAALFIYLNRTCFNGLHRTNSDGLFNVPAGKHKNPNILNEAVIRAASRALQGVDLRRADFGRMVGLGYPDGAAPGEVIYLDPPYVPVSKTSAFTAYAAGGFTMKDQERLADAYRQLDARGCLLALSQSDTPLVRALYAGYDMTPIQAPRSGAAKATSRGSVTELLIRNVDRYP